MRLMETVCRNPYGASTNTFIIYCQNRIVEKQNDKMVDHCLTNFSVVIVFFAVTIAAGRNDCPKIFSRSMWAAQKPKNPNLVRPLVNASAVVVHHTNTLECFTHGPCQNEMRTLQNDHFAEGYNDIAYNFVVTGSGIVYEGRGWKTQGDNPSAPGLIDRALIVAFHGTFESQLPHDRAIVSYRALIRCGVRRNIFADNRKPNEIAHRQLTTNTSCPGATLYKYMTTWP